MLGQPSATSAMVSPGSWSCRSSVDGVHVSPSSSDEGTHPSQTAVQKPVGPIWSPVAQQNLVKPAEGGKAALTRQQQIANAAASSFFAPTAPRAQRPSQQFSAESGAPARNGIGSTAPSPAAPPTVISAQQRPSQHAQHAQQRPSQHAQHAQQRPSQHAQHGQQGRANTPGSTASAASFEPSSRHDSVQQQRHMQHRAAGKPLLHPHQVQAQAAANLLQHQQASAALQKQNAQFNYPQAHMHQLAAAMQRPQQMGAAHASGYSQHGAQRFPLSRVSCDYPQAVSRQRASVDSAAGQLSGFAQPHRANSLDIALARQAQAAAERGGNFPPDRGGNFPPDSLWLGQTYSTHPAAGWPAQHDMQDHMSPQALQLQALNALNAMNRAPQQPTAQQTQWGNSRRLRHSGSALSEFGANAFQFPPLHHPPLLHRLSAEPHPSGSIRSSMEAAGSNFGGRQSPSQEPTIEASASMSELQGAWGSHLDAGDGLSSRPASSVSLHSQAQHNPFLQSGSSFSIREAKQLLQHPKPNPNRVIPRVDTFASTLHDAWGAHAKHESPPGLEPVLDSRPPRLSSDSLRSSASQSQGSSGKQMHRVHVESMLTIISHTVCAPSGD